MGIEKSRREDPPVLLTYGWVRSTYNALRLLSRKGIRVYSADSGSIGMCQQSRYRVKAFRYHDPLAEDEKLFIKDVNRFASKIGPLVLIPSHDETEILAKHRDELSPDINLPIGSWESIHQANDKALMAKRAASIGISVPTIIPYDSLAGLRDSLAVIEDHVVVKLRKGNSAKGVFYPRDTKETVATVERLIRDFSLGSDRMPIVQERVTGEGWGVSCLYWKGERIAHFTHRRLREKTETGGTSTLREARANPTLESMAFKLLDNLDWHGLAMVEFKYDPLTDKGWFIEINPRMWGSIGLAIGSGVEFPYLLYLCATRGPEVARSIFQKTVVKDSWKARWYLGDLIRLAGMKNKSANIRDILHLVLPGGADTMDDVYWDDPGAFLGEISNYLYRFMKSRSLNPIEKGMLG